MSVKSLSRRLERTQTVPLLLRTSVVRAYLAGVAAEHGVDADALRAEVEAVLTTWRSRDGSRVLAFEELLAEEARASGRTVGAVRAELLAWLAVWARSGRGAGDEAAATTDQRDVGATAGAAGVSSVSGVGTEHLLR